MNDNGEEVDINIKDILPGLFQGRSKKRRMKIPEALDYLTQEEEQKLIDMESVARTAVERVEQAGIIRHGAKMLYAWKEATVPKITCVIRKAYGGAFAAMSNKELGSDVVLGWPTTEIAIMGAEGAVRILFRKEIDTAADKASVREEKIQEYREKFMTPYYTAAKRQMDVLIRPQETRPQLITALEMLEGKKGERAERKPAARSPRRIVPARR